MHVRAVALALPLALGIACRTTHTRSDASAHAADVQSGRAGNENATAEPKPAPATPPASSAAAPSDQGSVVAGQPESNQTTSEPRVAPEDTTAPTSPAEGAPSASAGPSRDPLVEYGDAAKAHADDQVVSGTIASVTRRRIEISSSAGDRKTLFLVPETTIQVDGQDARRTDLQPGQDVRASFNQVNGRDVAVKIRAGQDAAAGSTEQGAAGSTGSGAASGSAGDTGGSSSWDSNTTGPTPSSPEHGSYGPAPDDGASGHRQGQ